LPFLRFTRDKRGYETTSLVHAGRQHGRGRQRLLYWFRTPPGVKVGRPALDEDAIRWIEEHNPDIEFDWQKILEVQPPAAPPPDDGRNRRGRRDTRDKTERPERDGRRRQAPAPPPALQRPAEPLPQAVPDAPSAIVQPEIADLPPIEEPLSPLIEDALEQITHPDAEELPPPSLAAVQSVVAREPLTRLRARYAELQARITERGGDAERIEQLRGQAEALNPDTWVTAEEVRKGLEEFEAKIRDLRAALGLRRRRRSRRGGRRRHKGGQASQPAVAGGETAAAQPEASNSAASESLSEADEDGDEE
jgi:hypothetical protein